jgi:BolA family transcriptional regulator, general stress-responsive regulator
MAMIDRIRSKLHAEFAPDQLEVIDESGRHLGHPGARPGGETHFRVVITAAAFRGRSRIERQRAIYAVLAAELAEGVHALSVNARASEE